MIGWEKFMKKRLWGLFLLDFSAAFDIINFNFNFLNFNFILLGKSVKNKFLFSMTA
jgi:hypothetical protein